MSKIYTIIAAGGLGTRLQHYDDSKKTKMLLEINGESMITKQKSGDPLESKNSTFPGQNKKAKKTKAQLCQLSKCADNLLPA